jgi:hypothetical protein
MSEIRSDQKWTFLMAQQELTHGELWFVVDDDTGMRRRWQILSVHNNWKFGGRQRSAPASMHLH